MNHNEVHSLFDPATATFTHVVWDTVTHDAVIIDSIIDFDPALQVLNTTGLQKVFDLIDHKNLTVHWILESHAHADHFSGGRVFKIRRPNVRWAMGSGMTQVFENFRKVYHWPSNVKLDQLGVDRWLTDGEEFSAGSLKLQAIATPGHTPACLTYKIGEDLFCGDAIFMPDVGTGRCDFPGGSASLLYDSIHEKIYGFPDHYRIFVGHDYPPSGRGPMAQTTVGQEKASNCHLKYSTAKSDFVAFREARDKTLTPPRLLDPSLDWNLGAHQLNRPTF